MHDKYAIRYMTRGEKFRARIKDGLIGLRRKMPYLVWYDDEIDVAVTLKDLGALGGEMSRVFEAQKLFREMGITFDSGSGFHGRDWEWDFSLRGPISVAFRSPAINPKQRIARHKLKLVKE